MRRYLTAILVMAVLLPGCGGGQQQTVQKGQISKAELRDELTRFENVFVASMKQAAAEIDTADQTRRMHRTNLRMRVRTIEALHAMTASDDSIVAFLDTWSFVMRLHIFFEEGAGSRLFGEHQPIVVDFIKTTKSEMIRIAELFLKQKQLEQVQRDLEIFARENPITGLYTNLIVYPTSGDDEKKGQDSALLRTLSIPMAPIRAMEGVDNTATAIHNVRNSVERFTDIAEQMPELTRWQMTILMDDFEESEMTQSFLKSLDDFSQSSTRLVEVLDTMPQELLTVLEESDQSQQQLQTTLQTAAEAADRVEKMFTQLSTTSQALNITAQQANDAGIAWKNASDSIQDLVRLFKGKPRDPNAPPGFGMRDFDTMLLNAGQTADKVSAAVVHIQQTVDNAAKEEMQKQLRSLIDHMAWRLFQLILVVCGVSLAFCVVKKKVINK